MRRFYTKKTALTSKTVCCLKVTKRSRIEVKVSKSSVSAPFDKLEFAYLFFAFANATRLRIIVMETNATEAIKTARIVSSIAA